jgi:Leucine-rich repeat (LRR) protein
MAITRKRRWLSFTVRGLLMVTTVAAMTLGGWRWWESFYRQAVAAAQLKALGGEIETVDAVPDWACRFWGGKRFQNVTSVDLSLNKSDQWMADMRPLVPEAPASYDEIDTPVGPIRANLSKSEIYCGPTELVDARPFRKPTDNDLLAPLAQLPHLQTLKLSGSNLSDVTIARLQCAESLTTLDLSYTLIRDDSLAAIGRCKNLRVLRLRGCNFTDDGLRHIAQCSQLERLDLAYTQVTDEGIKHLLALDHLKKIDVSETKITAKAYELLKR